jgi:hypothetical protein
MYGVAAPTVVCWELTGDLDVTGLVSSLRTTLLRYDAVRTTFPGLRPDVCAVAEPGEIGEFVEVLDLGAGESPVEVVRERLIRPFDLEHGPLVRCVVVRAEKSRWLLGFAADHTVWDAVSLSVFIRDFAVVYEKKRPAEAISYTALSREQRRLMTGEWGQRCEAFWTSRFDFGGGYPPPSPLPHSEAGGSDVDRSDVVVRRELDEASMAGLRALCGRHRAAGFAVITTLLLQAAGELGAVEHPGLVTDVHGRMLPGSVGAVGLFSHGVPVQLDLSEHLTLGDRVRAVRDEVLELLDHAVPLRSFAGRWRSQTGVPSNPTMMYFAVDDDAGFAGLLRLSGVTVRRFPLYDSDDAHPGRASTMLALQASISGRAPEIKAQFDALLFPVCSVEKLLDAAVVQLGEAAS